MSPRTTAATGERLVFCSLAECAFSGNEVTRSLETVLTDDRRGVPYFVCEADVLVMDRRIAFGKPCARYAKKS